MKRWLTLVILICNILPLSPLFCKEGSGEVDRRCPLADIPPPRSQPADFHSLLKLLNEFGVSTRDGELYATFHSAPEKTKLEQFFRLLYYIQRHHTNGPPIEVGPPKITDVLLAAKVFRNDSFPNQITLVTLKEAKGKKNPQYTVHFRKPEVRFPLNEGIGFAAWEVGKCQHAKELIFQDGFRFRLKENRKNLIVYDFEGVELFGDFGARKAFMKIDLNYVKLEQVEFLDGTDEGKVKTRVSKREFATNPHSFLFRWVGRMIPDHSRQRIDW